MVSGRWAVWRVSKDEDQPATPLRPIRREPDRVASAATTSSGSWYLRGAAQDEQPLDRLEPATVARDVARPQEIEQPRQVILEWSRSEPPTRRYKPRIELDASAPSNTVRR